MRPISHERIQTLRSLMEIKASYPVLHQKNAWLTFSNIN